MQLVEDTVAARPRIYVTPVDLERLRRLAANPRLAAAGGRLLAEEVGRMAAVPDGTPARFVRLGAHVTYLDLRTKRRRRVRVVMPEAVAPDENHVSVASPIGAALIGLPEHVLFRWRAEDGGFRAIKVILIEP